ncbi:prolyl 3,4-dihydroxylase Tpa1p [[Candida] jaroonii]|uniref:Prolyl 3,4-dihydroxylase Tpa1p n=1 Tax=[Candida] jaroonii TaxID=467808 RepID=A0ACA9Y7D2_9ASCO|nr:prolyl 3,4-dihydroxylase Tpa1p [[Candida] jaroonii]
MVDRIQQSQQLQDNATKKKLKTDFNNDEIVHFFQPKIWDQKYQQDLKQEIKDSQPYRWGTIKELMNDQLLRNVRTEVMNEISFTKKETDIYKVYQSGDLANLSGLDWDDLSRLPSLYELRAAIYSEQFRDFISTVTGCGKLSGKKTDMSINSYTTGCHLLTHDDVIGSRRVSFILYLPDPNEIWEEEFGGALRLFPSIVPNVPCTDYSAKLIPQFNQIAFFTVQPGLSFHDVEEVRMNKYRLSIQGWFHIPQPGEDGFIPGEQEMTENKSTLQQLQSKELQEFDFPKPYRTDFLNDELKIYNDLEKYDFSEEEVQYLSKFINETYLKEAHIEQLNKNFIEESIIEITQFLNDDYADTLWKLLRSTEIEKPAPENSKQIQFPWKCAIPPHKQRYMYIDGKPSFDLDEKSIRFENKLGSQESPNFSLLQKLNVEDTDSKLVELSTFMKSIVFKKWLTLITSLIPTSEQLLVRRFRPGHDFILATTTDKKLAREHLQEANVLLEATLNLTPTAKNPENWESGEFGGYELCMSLDNEDGEFEDDDPAIYKPSDPNDDSVLYSSQCKWNSLTLIVRDPSVLKFIKYVSINARGSRWDISCQWNVRDQDDEEEDQEQDQED